MTVIPVHRIRTYGRPGFVVSRIPNLFIVGAPRAGTTTVYALLQRSPDVFTGPVKEPWTLALRDLEDRWEGPGDDGMVVRDFSIYTSLYESSKDQRYVLDASTIYLWSRAAVDEIGSHSPDAKIIVCLRDPVDRAYSHYMWHRTHGVEEMSFEEAIRAEADREAAKWSPRWRYFALSLYADALQRYLRAFGKDRIIVVLYDNLSTAWGNEVDRLSEFLGINLDRNREHPLHLNQSGSPKISWIRRLVRGSTSITRLLKPILPEQQRHHLRAIASRWEHQWNTGPSHRVGPETRSWLLPHYIPDIERTEQVAGLQLDAWKSG